MIALLIVVLLIVSFLFSGIEAGILSVNRVRLRHQLNQGDASAKVLSELLEAPARALTTVLIVTNLCNIAALALSAKTAVAHLGTTGYWVALGVALPVYLLGLELFPKFLFRRFPYRALAVLARVLQTAMVIFQPVLALLGLVHSRIFPEIEKAGGRSGLFVAREEVKFLLSEGERMGTLSPVERELIHGVVDFRNIKARDLMVPIQDVVSVGPDTGVEEMIRISRERNLDRLPILDEAGRIIGLVNIFEMLMEQRPKTGATHYLRRIVVAKENEPAFQVIRRLRAARLSLAAVVDIQNGRSLGILGTEDILARMVKLKAVEKV